MFGGISGKTITVSSTLYISSLSLFALSVVVLVVLVVLVVPLRFFVSKVWSFKRVKRKIQILAGFQKKKNSLGFENV